MIVKVVVFAVLSSLAVVSAQAPVSPAPKFEVISIRAVAPDAPQTIRPPGFDAFQPGGRYIDSDTNLFSLITVAYGVTYPDYRLLGLPPWKARRFAVAAKAAEGVSVSSPDENREQVRLMLREMLADRFRLRLHTELRQETILRMSVETNGLLLKEVPAPIPPEQEGRVSAALGDRGGRIIGTKATMAGLARVVGLFLRQDVIDETGVSGYFDFDIRWTAPAVPNLPRPSSSLGAQGIALFLSTLKEQFGLRFSRAVGPVQYWVVDRVELPTED